MVEAVSRKKANHPSHHHHLAKADTREIYPAFRARWHCDACRRILDGMKDSLVSGQEGEEPDNRTAYHCPQCNYDICTQCFRGDLHPFHHHRLKKARAPLLYPETEGQWRCDACKRIFTEMAEQDCYTCQDCQVDLCSRCYKGEWKHVLHSIASEGHSLMPVNPVIKYHYYYDWTCDNCHRRFDYSNTPEVMFHCPLCQFDLCPDCYTGTKHHLHQHNLVEASISLLRVRHCTHCRTVISERYARACRDPSCNFTLCNKCYYTVKPVPHPFHPSHPLELCDPAATYPQSGGLWHCDRCTSNHPRKEASPLSPEEPMHHCEKCQFDLCQRCYRQGLGDKIPPHRDQMVHVTPMEIQGQLPTFQRYTMQHYSMERPVTGFQPLSYLHDPLAPPRRLCLICERNLAVYTFVHNGQPHYERNSKICCYTCGMDAVRYKRRCPLCNQVPDEISNLSD